MKQFAKTIKENKSEAILLAVLIILIVAYLVSMYTWMKGMWNVPFADLKVKHGIEGGLWASSARIIYKWTRKHVFCNDRG